jgi:Mn-containing catalase
MPNTNLVEILKMCLSLESQAVACYRILSDSSENKNIQQFWKRMSNQEKQHQSYWSKLLEMADIHNLRNLVPICMYCKNVRSDKEFWGKVENYIEDHSSMQFSHGICPDCIIKYFPEYGLDKE